MLLLIPHHHHHYYLILLLFCIFANKKQLAVLLAFAKCIEQVVVSVIQSIN